MGSTDNLCKILINILFSDKSGILSAKHRNQLNQVLNILIINLQLSPYDIVSIIDANDFIPIKTKYMSNKDLNTWLSSVNEMIGVMPNDVNNSKARVLFILLSYIDNRVVRIMLSRTSSRLPVVMKKSQKKLDDDSIKKMKHLNDQMRNKIYSDFVTILGVFTAITFATFGGLQLLSHVFNDVGNLTHIGLGKTISVSAIFLFGVYLILLILFNGISKLTYKRHKYIISPCLNFYLISGFLALFILGALISYSNNSIKHINFITVTSLGSILLLIMIIDIVIFCHKNKKKITKILKNYFSYKKD